MWDGISMNLVTRAFYLGLEDINLHIFQLLLKLYFVQVGIGVILRILVITAYGVNRESKEKKGYI